jgi:hypothetical protein
MTLKRAEYRSGPRLAVPRFWKALRPLFLSNNKDTVFAPPRPPSRRSSCESASRCLYPFLGRPADLYDDPDTRGSTMGNSCEPGTRQCRYGSNLGTSVPEIRVIGCFLSRVTRSQIRPPTPPAAAPRRCRGPAEARRTFRHVSSSTPTVDSSTFHRLYRIAHPARSGGNQLNRRAAGAPFRAVGDESIQDGNRPDLGRGLVRTTPEWRVTETQASPRATRVLVGPSASVSAA